MTQDSDTKKSFLHKGQQNSLFTILEFPAEKHVGDESAGPLIILGLCDVVHDEPGPDVQVAVVDGLQDEADEGEAEQDNRKPNLEFRNEHIGQQINQ